MSKHTYITKADSITVYLGGKAYTALKTHPNYVKIVSGVQKDKSAKKLIALFDTTAAIKSYCSGDEGNIEIKDGALFYKGKVLQNHLTTKILRMMDEGFDINPMTNFLENLRNNPSKAAQDELMLFMEVNEMPITPDGHFLSYKSVNSNFKDYHSGTFDNSIGKICEMERFDVDDNRKNTCSNGLHIGAKEYAGSFGGRGHLMIVKVDPKDVVSIPYDYKNMKGRVCRYEVIGEVPKESKGKDDYNTKAVHVEEELECSECGADVSAIDTECPSCGEQFDN